MDGKLTGAQAALTLQEETLRWSEQERKAQADKRTTLEHDLQAAESERRATQVGVRDGAFLQRSFCPAAPLGRGWGSGLLPAESQEGFPIPAPAPGDKSRPTVRHTAERGGGGTQLSAGPAAFGPAQPTPAEPEAVGIAPSALLLFPGETR